PYAGKMKVPVLLYMFVIIIMAWQAWERWLSLQQTGALLAGIGSSLFLLSDFTLAINRFRKNFVSADLIVLSTYYLSLWFISLSVLYTFVHEP
ncbi:MAG: lysoplasmalogenase, partial [Desulfobacteraceae bacterium]|nr:lysoplasmalogenase [Desulfobacteraceae bacterium]